jgi:Tfp pilus assembly protein PilX
MKQQGMALIVALVITLIIGIIAVAIGRSALQNQHSASNQYDLLRSYTSAQSAMNRAERLFKQTVINDESKIYSSTPQAISSTLDDADWWQDPAKWAANATAYNGLTAGAPQFRIEQRQFIPFSADIEEKNGQQFFRVSSRGEGPGSAVSMIQAYFTVVVPKPEK